jgi:hypothetical protein
MTLEQFDWMLLLGNAISTWFMTGLIWFVQVVHYPLKSTVGRDAFVAYQEKHVTRTGWVVGPPMLVEAATTLGLVLLSPAWLPESSALIGLGLLGMIWLSTAVFSIPAHTRLAAGFESPAFQRLVLTNWLRTVGWTLRSGLVIWMLSSVVMGGGSTY